MTEGHQLRLFNSLGRRLEDFVPAGATTGIYTCGPTVYSFPHLGNLRAYVFADTLRRALRWKGISFRQVINITDVGHAVADSDTGEDKLEVAAARERRSVADIAAFYTDAFFKDLAALNIPPADEYPRASDYVEQMIEFAAKLEAGGYTYELPSGLYFDTSKSPDYGALARIDVEGQREAARVEQVQGRRRKSDFALWRAEEEGQRRVMRWESPWGPGAPGWHLECSVMSMALLGEHFDIHTGGVDHLELHHVNEIAQSEAYLGEPWVRYWLHNEFLQLGAQKMAKSKGGAPLLTDLAEAGYHPMAFRLFLLGGHYRSQLDYTPHAIDSAQTTLRRLVARIEPLRPLPPVDTLAAARAQLAAAAGADPTAPGPAAAADPTAERMLDQIDAAMSDDLATPRVLAVLQECLRDSSITPPGQRVIIAAADALLGLQLATLTPAEVDKQRTPDDLTSDERAAIDQLVTDRTEARASRDWTRADQIRAELDQRGVQVTDTPQGPTWQLT